MADEVSLDGVTIRRRKVTDYTPDSHNANRGTERGARILEDSLRQLGAGRSVVAAADDTLPAGNKTLETAASIGIEDVIEVETDGRTLVVVKRKDWETVDDPDARQYAWTDNRAGEVNLDWDAEQLFADVQAGIDLSRLFTEQELGELFAGVRPEPPADPGAQLDRAEELREAWGTERGQVWEIPSLSMPGKAHRVMCGDSADGDDIGRLMGESRALLMATDPPYGDAWVQKARDMHELGYGFHRAATCAEIVADDLSDGEFGAFLSTWLRVAIEHALIAPAAVYVWHRARRTQFELALITAGCHVHQPVVWVKRSFVFGRLNYHPRCEWCLHGWVKGDGKAPFYGERNQSDVWELDREGDWYHPTQKPVELFARPIRNHLRRGEIAYDPFVGSGTAMIAAEQNGCLCRACEIDPCYVAITLQRLNDMGLEPRLMSGT